MGGDTPAKYAAMINNVNSTEAFVKSLKNGNLLKLRSRKARIDYYYIFFYLPSILCINSGNNDYENFI